MKRGTPDHHKMRRFARLSGVPKVYALAWANGALERLWHYTAKYAIRGDIGRITNREIAEVCCYPIKRADHLIDILVQCEWLDRHPDYRLVVHDWADHADDSTRKTVKNRGLGFIQKLATTQQGWHENENIFEKTKIDPRSAFNKTKDLEASFPESFRNVSGLPFLSFPTPAVEKEEAVHTHTNSTLGACAKSDPAMNGKSASGPKLQRLDEFLAVYPDQSDPDSTARAYRSCVTVKTENACHECLARYVASDRVARNVVKSGENWLRQQARNGFTGTWAAPPSRKPSALQALNKILKEEKQTS